MHIPRLIVSSSQFSNPLAIRQSSKDTPRENNLRENNLEEYQVELNEQQSHHLSRVLRRKNNSSVELLIRENSLLCRGTISIINKKKALVTIDQKLETIFPNPRVHILLGQPSSKSLEQVIQQGTETGVSSFQIYPAEFTGARKPLNISRLELIRDNAVEQARLSHIPKILTLSSLTATLNQLPAANVLKILCSSPNEPSSKLDQPTIISALFAETEKKAIEANSPLEKHRESVEIYIAVGPEGGFSLAEIDLHLGNGFQTTSLGPYVARVETAVTIAAGISRLAAKIY